MKEELNTAVLVIDDEEMVRDNIEEILVPPLDDLELESLRDAASILFDTPKPLLVPHNHNIPVFTVDKASNGMQGLEMVIKSLENGHPYAVIFLDMRMPGWDGLETAQRIRKYDSKAEIIFVTAFSDHSIEDIVEQAGQNVGYHCKPYASEEIVQLATKAVTDYNKLRNLEKLIDVISSISLDEQQLTSLLRNILDQLAGYVDTDMALMGRLYDDYTYEKIFSIGALEESINLDELIARVKTIHIGREEVVQIEEVVLARVDNYLIFAALKKQEKLKTEKLYLLKLFVQSAAKAIQNAELHEQLLQKEKLSAVGKAVGMVMHDLRPPIQYIKILTGLLRADHVESRWLDALDQCGDQASEIFEDFLDFIKETPVKKLPVNLNKVIEEGIHMADERNSLDTITIIRRNIVPGLIIAGDESKLRRVVMNLVSNAVDILKDKKVPDPCIDISVEAVEDVHQVIIRMKDNGPGIPPEIIRTIFEPFVTKHKSNGTGLGLAIVKQYITAHGGTISVENEGGAVFTISLPY
jgi:signal transduction histidine kinase/CheY-like chemotaxis protein